MAAHGAFRLLRMSQNLKKIIAIELLCAAQGVEFRAPLKTSLPLQACIKACAKIFRHCEKTAILPKTLSVPQSSWDPVRA